MGLLSVLWAIIFFFVKLIFLLIGLIITVPIAFILSVIVSIITGAILYGMWYVTKIMLPEETVEKIGNKFDALEDRLFGIRA